ncbi:MAG: hypothetical protein H7831_08060 [Magnetococcus sp. WYHC-3]
MKSPQEIIEQVLSGEMEAPEGIAPSILMHRNIDHENVVGYTSCYVNDSWQEKLSGLISAGWIVFRIQTELNSNGHYTMAYLAKMKS